MALAPLSHFHHRRSCETKNSLLLRLVWLFTPLAVLTMSSHDVMGGAGGDRGLTAVPTTGTAPLRVTFTGVGGGAVYFGGVRLEFGDGNSVPFCPPGLSCQRRSLTHVYMHQGVFRARLLAHGEGDEVELGVVVVRILESR